VTKPSVYVPTVVIPSHASECNFNPGLQACCKVVADTYLLLLTLGAQ